MCIINSFNMMLLCYVVIVTLASVYGTAIPQAAEEKLHHMQNDAEKLKHFESKGEHDPQYDHEQFLGEDESKTFDRLPPEESRRRLGIIADKIDTNKDGFVDQSELKSWIQYSQRRYIDEDVERQWKLHNPDNNDTILWEVYRKNIYGFLDELDPSELEKDDGYLYKKMLARDRRRWSVADSDVDDKLTKEEFTAFLHPEELKQMRDVVLTETIEDIDKNNDGKITVDEYIADMYKSQDDEEEPEWVTNERDIFKEHRDKNHDGYLDREEVRDWITPPDFDHSEAEARHLIYEADTNGDEKLTKDEILDKYDLFVGSQATDFGEALIRHDEF